MTVEADVAGLHEKARWNVIAVEQNNTGEHVIEALRRTHGLPVRPVITAGKVTDPKKIRRGGTMSKPDMVYWILRAKQRHLLKFPRDARNADLLELQRQISIFSEHITEAGSASYYAPGTEKDDGVMSFMLCCHVARRWIRLGDDASAYAAPLYPGSEQDLIGEDPEEELMAAFGRESLW